MGRRGGGWLRGAALAALFSAGVVASSGATGFHIALTGSAADAPGNPRGGAALMGGGPDVDAAFAWMAERADGGDFVVLRASGGDAYNDYILGLPGVSLDSVATLVVRQRAAASNPEVAAAIAGAEAIFIAGGDQAVYLERWRGTPLQTALQERIDAGAVVGGSSAGLAVLSGHVYSARRGTVTSRQALDNPFGRRMTLAGTFLRVPNLERVVADSHFSERDREGRLVAFVARLFATDPVRGIGVDEATALLVEPDGTATVVGDGRVLFVDPDDPPDRLSRGRPLVWSGIAAAWADAGDAFDLRTWTGRDADRVVLSARRGRLRETAAP